METYSYDSPSFQINQIYRRTRFYWNLEENLNSDIKLPHPDFDRLPDVDFKETDVCFSESLTVALNWLNNAFDALEH